jgi:hypothetical protein
VDEVPAWLASTWGVAMILIVPAATIVFVVRRLR